MYGGNAYHKPGAKKGAAKATSLPIEKFDDFVPRTPGANPKKGKLISAFPVGEKRCRVRRAAYDEQSKQLFIILSEASSENIYASIQVYKLNGKVFEKQQEPLSAGRIGGLVVLGGHKVVVTMMQKDPKAISAMSLKPKWEAFKYDDNLSGCERLNTDKVPPPPQNDSWVLSEAGPNFFLTSPEQTKMFEYKKSGSANPTREVKCMKMTNLESMTFFPDHKTFITVHRDKAYRWADRMNYHAFVHKMNDGACTKLSKIDHVDMGMLCIFDKTKVLLSRRKPLWDTLDFQTVDHTKPDDLKLIDSKCKLIRPMVMVGTEKVLVSLDDTKDTQFGLMQLSF